MLSQRAGACSAISAGLGDPLAGTASTTAGYLLIEHGGPWGRKALEEAQLPDAGGVPTDLGLTLAATCKANGITPLLVRRHGAAPGLPARPMVALVVLDGHSGRGARTEADDVHALAGWDVAGLLQQLRDGRVPNGWQPMTTQYLVCTHGRRDACCAELGRPLAAVLDGLAREQVWEVSHIGGHRLAANLLVLPDGVVYGRLDPDDALALVAAHAEHRVVPAAMRGRAALPPPLQAAEIALRQASEVDGAGGVALEASETAGLGQGVRTTSRWRVGDAHWRVVVETEPGDGPPRPASCGADDTPAPDRHTVVEVTDVEAAGRGAAGWDEAHAVADSFGEPNADVVSIVSGLPVGSALDVACGSGRHSFWLAEKGWRVTGLDFSRAGLQRAAAEAGSRGLDVDWQLGDARAWSPTGPVDLVLMAFVHLPGALARAARWVAPDGHLVLVAHARRNLADGVGGPSDPRLLYDPAELREQAGAAGFDVLRCEEVERDTGDGTAVDVILVARRAAGRDS